MVYNVKSKKDKKEKAYYKVLDFEKKHGLTFVGNVDEILEKEKLNKSETKFVIKKLEGDGMVFDKNAKSYLLEQAEWRKKPYVRYGVQPKIQTINGEKSYYKTEVEDENGKWNDDYSIKDGFWVIHKGKLHHIYK